MAHANPEFALGLMRHEPGLVSHQLPAPASLRELRVRMRDIERRVVAAPGSVSAEEWAQLQLWRRVVRQQRAQFAREDQIRASIAEPVGGMHAASKRSERFLEPKRRLPADVQAGRVKVRRGTLPR